MTRPPVYGVSLLTTSSNMRRQGPWGCRQGGLGLQEGGASDLEMLQSTPPVMGVPADRVPAAGGCGLEQVADRGVGLRFRPFEPPPSRVFSNVLIGYPPIYGVSL